MAINVFLFLGILSNRFLVHSTAKTQETLSKTHPVDLSK
jgi:hypothetical protein